MNMEEEIQVRLPWEKICKLAVKARVMNISFNDVCVRALEQKLSEPIPKKKRRKK
jgi:hypothetical protein